MIPQAGWSSDGENDLVANVISLGVIAMHSLAVYLNLDTVVGRLIDLRHHCPVPGFSTYRGRLKGFGQVA